VRIKLRLLVGLLVGLLMLGLLTACRSQPDKESSPDMPHITFLTRAGCSGSPQMLAGLRAALTARGVTLEPETLDLGDLAADDPRTGYGTPTILVDGHDLFGRSQPVASPPN